MGLIGFLWFVVSIVSLVGFVWMCVLAFRKHIGWGLAVFFLSPIGATVFAIKHWQESKKPFLIYAGSTVAFFVLAIFAFSAMGGFQMMDMAHRMSQGEEISDEEAAEFIQAQIERMESSGMLSPQEEAELRKMQEMVKGMQQEQPGAGSAPTSTTTIALNAPGQSRETLRELERVPSTGAPAPGTIRTTPLPKRRSRESSTTLPSGDPVPPGYKRVSVGDANRYVGRTIRIVDKDGNTTKGKLADVDSNYLLVERYLTSGVISFELSTGDVDSLLVAYR
jgi:hypothetical protein